MQTLIHLQAIIVRVIYCETDKPSLSFYRFRVNASISTVFNSSEPRIDAVFLSYLIRNNSEDFIIDLMYSSE